MKRIAALLGVLALSTAAFGSFAQAGRPFMVTGGGQTDIGTEGAGDTIAFTARDTDGDAGNAARGQVQYVDREDGEVVEVYHGTVNCLQTADGGSEGAAYLAGEWTKQGPAGPFEIYVADNGEGAAADDDLIFIDNMPEAADCAEDENEDQDPTALGRGNIQVHQAN